MSIDNFGGEKRVLDNLELELQWAMSHNNTVTWNRNWLLWENQPVVLATNPSISIRLSIAMIKQHWPGSGGTWL